MDFKFACKYLYKHSGMWALLLKIISFLWEGGKEGLGKIWENSTCMKYEWKVGKQSFFWLIIY